MQSWLKYQPLKVHCEHKKIQFFHIESKIYQESKALPWGTPPHLNQYILENDHTGIWDQLYQLLWNY